MTSVYLMGNREQNKYKIGISNDTKKRLNTISTSTPFPCYLLHAIERDQETARCIEQWLHQEFSSKCIHGEWFTDISVEGFVSKVTWIEEEFLRHAMKLWMQEPHMRVLAEERRLRALERSITITCPSCRCDMEVDVTDLADDPRFSGQEDNTYECSQCDGPIPLPGGGLCLGIGIEREAPRC